MPRLEIGGVKFSVGSDDLFLPGLVGFFNRLVFVVVNVVFVAFGFGVGLEECGLEFPATDEERVLVGLGFGFLMLMVACLVNYGAIFYVATRGTPADMERRKSMPKLLVSLNLIYLLEFGFAIGLTYLLVVFPPREGVCAGMLQQKFNILVFSVVIIWADLIMYILSTYIFLHRYDSKNVPEIELDDFSRSELGWEKCFRVWCRMFRVLTCNLFGYVESEGEDADEAYRAVAEVFNSFFDKTNLTLTDLFTALILIRADQRKTYDDEQRYWRTHRDSKYHTKQGKKTVIHKKKQYENSVPAMDLTAPQESFVDLESGPMPSSYDVDAARAYDIMKDSNNYMAYMLGMYGWKLLIYRHVVEMKPFTGLRKVLHMPNKASDIGHGDNCCNCSKHALLEETQIDPKNVIYGSFGSVAKDQRKSLQVPHAVFVDHDKKSVVVALRGTFSLQDMMTDAILEPESLVNCGRFWGFDGKNRYAHHGMLKCAMQIRGIFEKNLVLHRLLGVQKRQYEVPYPEMETLGIEALNVDINDLPDCKGYELVVVGHSLGAAVGGLLTMMLRPTFPSARCIAFSMPGCVVSENLAEECNDWCTNIWLNHDIVPQLNWQSLNNIRLRVFDVLYRCKVSKWRVFRSIFTGETADDLLFESYEIPDSEERRIFKDKQFQFMSKRASKKLEQIPMYGMGIPLHLSKVETVTEYKMCGLFKRKKRIFEPHLLRDRRVMEDPLITTRCLFDHFANLYPAIMQEIIERHQEKFDERLL